jgi:DNA-directed RNA polymerase specialized sigma24 family protein
MTSSRPSALSAVVDHVASVGASRAARRAGRRWSEADEVLAGYGSPAEVADACRAARGADQDRLLAALLRVCSGDEWAQLTVLAGLAERLRWVVTGWARAGLPPWELADAEAELVARCWTAIAACGQGPPPGRPGLALVDVAWQSVRVSRQRQRRQDALLCPLPADLPEVAHGGRPTLEVLAGQVTEAVVEDRLALRPAQAVYLTRVSGLSTVEAGRLLGCRPGVLRMVRSRAERRLAA